MRFALSAIQCCESSASATDRCADISPAEKAVVVSAIDPCFDVDRSDSMQQENRV
jgi:hypothetical protein